jgi:hypothetical protein
MQIDFIKIVIKDPKSPIISKYLSLILLQQSSECDDYDYMVYLKTKLTNRLKVFSEFKPKEKQITSNIGRYLFNKSEGEDGDYSE